MYNMQHAGTGFNSHEPLLYLKVNGKTFNHGLPTHRLDDLRLPEIWVEIDPTWYVVRGTWYMVHGTWYVGMVLVVLFLAIALY